MGMKDTEKLQIYVTYGNGAMQSWGYDGHQFTEYADVLADIAQDFPDNFTESYKGVVSMLLVWGEGLPVGDELDSTPTKEIDPVYGQTLVTTVADWLIELGVLTNGN